MQLEKIGMLANTVVSLAASHYVLYSLLTFINVIKY